LTSQVDHLVIAASTLTDGVAWCESTLGITPGAGGEHPLMGTHNRLFSIASPMYPSAYLEIIAINRRAAYSRIQGENRWFDLDSEAVQLSLKQNGPQLLHFVASTPHAAPAVAALANLGIDRGEFIAASRMSAHGLLSWQITVRADGQRLMNGTLPTLIVWGDVHPAQHMAASGVTLQSLTACQPDMGQLRAAYAALNLQGVTVAQGQANLAATLQTPRGLVTLPSCGL
jgi:hypothetical protein